MEDLEKPLPPTARNECLGYIVWDPEAADALEAGIFSSEDGRRLILVPIEGRCHLLTPSYARYLNIPLSELMKLARPGDGRLKDASGLFVRYRDVVGKWGASLSDEDQKWVTHCVDAIERAMLSNPSKPVELRSSAARGGPENR